MDNSICAVVVWYNPTEEMVQNIRSYNKFVSKVYIVDNSNFSNINLLKNKNDINFEYIPKLENLGIAKALNIGCEKAIKEKYEWILTMDQDSNFEKKNLKNYFDFVKNKNSEIGIVCPIYKYSHFQKVLYKKSPFEEIDKVITSGNLVNLKAYLEVGKYNEDFFIDQVDFDFCKQLNKINKKIIQMNSIFLNHSLGNSEEKKILGKSIVVTNHSPIRRYYMSRNIMYMIKKYPNLRIKYIGFIFLEFFKIILFEKNKNKKLNYFFKGIIDFFYRKIGKI
ncbi:MAG: glycosyltransferase family 2 protein [Fusobacteriaceae bacterium]